jgi:uncharacterized protein (TIGR03086 family)
MTAEGLERAWVVSRAIVANVTPDQLHESTPCQSWDVHDLLNHMIEVTALTDDWFAKGKAEHPERDYAEGDYLATFDTGVASGLAAIRAPGGMEGDVELSFGALPKPAWLGMITTDAFIHAWDLAKATGQATDLDPELAAELLEQSRMFIQPAFRGDDGVMPFGPEQPAPAGASKADELGAFLGRTV